MIETKLSSALVKKFRTVLPHYITFKHPGHVTAGVPDVSTTGDGTTTWFEAKRLVRWRDAAGTTGPQYLNIQRMAEQGSVYYVVYSDPDNPGEEKSVRIYHPNAAMMHNGRLHFIEKDALLFAPGHNHLEVVRWVQDLHKSKLMRGFSHADTQ